MLVQSAASAFSDQDSLTMNFKTKALPQEGLIYLLPPAAFKTRYPIQIPLQYTGVKSYQEKDIQLPIMIIMIEIIEDHFGDYVRFVFEVQI